MLRSTACISIAIVVSVCLLSACSNTSLPSSSSPPTASESSQSTETVVKAEVSSLYDFINTKLTGSHGVYTNLQDTDQSSEAATGHEILSESAGIMMRAAVLSGDKELFADQWETAKEIFDMTSGFSYRYSPKLQKRYAVNAAVDDLRLIRALYEAGEAFEDNRYTEEANKYGQRLYSNNVKDGYLYDFYDDDYKLTNNFITLCYINSDTMRKLSLSSESRDQLMSNMGSILESGYLSDEFPFYETRFNYETGAYSSENINTVESLLSILALAEVDQHRSSSIQYIKQQVEAGTLFGQYTREGTPLNDIRSTAIYAITAMIGSEIGDGDLYRESIERMNEFRITDTGSALYGGFGDEQSGQAYSFDNLMALLAYMYSI